MDATTTYRLIKGSRRRVSGLVQRATFSLWAANDHLLLAERSWFFERFKRFDFQDVQGLVMTPSWVHWVARGALLAVVAAFGVAAIFLLSGGEEVGGVVFLVLLLLLLPFLVWDFYRGPSCRTFLVTAVQRVELPSLNRVKNAQRVIAEIADLIRATQGEIRAEDCPPEAAGVTSRPVVPVFASQPAEQPQPS